MMLGTVGAALAGTGAMLGIVDDGVVAFRLDSVPSGLAAEGGSSVVADGAAGCSIGVSSDFGGVSTGLASSVAVLAGSLAFGAGSSGVSAVGA